MSKKKDEVLQDTVQAAGEFDEVAELEEFAEEPEFSDMEAALEANMDDSFKMYLKEIREIPLLSAQEERRLAELTEKGDAEARKKLIASNIRLVVSIAKRYMNRGMSLSDLVQEGTVNGLIAAIDRFDYTKGNRLSTYATWWIKQSILRALNNQAKAVRIPEHIAGQVNRLKCAQRNLAMELGHEPGHRELAAELGISEGKALELMKYALDATSLDAPKRKEGEDDSDSTVGDFETDKNPGPEELVMDAEMQEKVVELMETLDEASQAVLICRFGLFGEPALTLDACAERFHISRDSIQKIEAKAIRRLRERNAFALEDEMQ